MSFSLSEREKGCDRTARCRSKSFLPAPSDNVTTTARHRSRLLPPYIPRTACTGACARHTIHSFLPWLHGAICGAHRRLPASLCSTPQRAAPFVWVLPFVWLLPSVDNFLPLSPSSLPSSNAPEMCEAAGQPLASATSSVPFENKKNIPSNKSRKCFISRIYWEAGFEPCNYTCYDNRPCCRHETSNTHKNFLIALNGIRRLACRKLAPKRKVCGGAGFGRGQQPAATRSRVCRVPVCRCDRAWMRAFVAVAVGLFRFLEDRLARPHVRQRFQSGKRILFKEVRLHGRPNVKNIWLFPLGELDLMGECPRPFGDNKLEGVIMLKTCTLYTELNYTALHCTKWA